MNRMDAKRLTHVRSLPVRSERGSLGRRPLWIRTVASPSIGFGHLRRVLTLAAMLENAVEPHFLVDSNDSWSKDQTTARGWKYSDFDSTGLWNGSSRPAAILIDTREERGLEVLISAARQRRVPVASIHDLGLNRLSSDVVIDGSLAPGIQQNCAARCYFGTRYLVLDPKYAAAHRVHRRISNEIRTVLINLGGGDSSRFFEKVLEGLRLWGHGLQAVGVRGFASWGQEQLASRNWAPVHFRWAARNESIPELIRSADLAVTAAGISVYEALCAGTPVISLSYDETQHRTAESLAAAGLCVDLGLGDHLTSALIPPLLTHLESDPGLRVTASRQGKRLVDGKGAERVAAILVELIGDDGCAKHGQHSEKNAKKKRRPDSNSAPEHGDALTSAPVNVVTWD